MIVVQLVEIEWTKRSRGGPAAGRRARLPRAFALPGIPAPFVLQHVSLGEWNDFTVRQHEERGAAPRAVEKALAIRVVGDGMLALGFAENPSHGGQPARVLRADAMRLAPGEFGRLSINARHATEDSWRYVEQVYNVCHDDVVPVDRFLDTAPDLEIDLTAALR